MSAKLWISAAETPFGNEYGSVVVLAETREEAIAKATAKLEAEHSGYVPDQRYAKALLDNLHTMSEVEEGAFVDWTATRRRF